jgi:two-component system chemotaxis response regulator CheY
MKRTVLVVDDDADLRDGLSEVLADADHEVLKAGGGVEALALLASLAGPCVVVTDLEMPGMDGVALTRAIRADASLSAVRVLVFSGRPTPLARDVADAMLSKPCDIATIRETIEALFSAAPRTRRRAARTAR